MTTPSFRDIEQLSAYLDGELGPMEAARLASRIATDPQLASVFEALRQSQAVLRHLPPRRAPRNFTLTPQMVRQKPPLPRAYPFFRFSTALAAVLLVFTFAINAISPLSLGARAPAPSYGLGGAATEEPVMAFEAPAATEAPAEPEIAPEPKLVVPAATQAAPPSADAAKVTPEAQAKPGIEEQARAPSEAESIEQGPIPLSWQIALGLLALVNLSIVFLMQKYASSKWRE